MGRKYDNTITNMLHGNGQFPAFIDDFPIEITNFLGDFQWIGLGFHSDDPFHNPRALNQHINQGIHVYIYIYYSMCYCICKCIFHISIYIYIYIYTWLYPNIRKSKPHNFYYKALWGISKLGSGKTGNDADAWRDSLWQPSLRGIFVCPGTAKT